MVSTRLDAVDTSTWQKRIDDAWERRDEIGPATTGTLREAVEGTLAGLDRGELRVAAKVDGEWLVHQWVKKAVLLSFRLTDMVPIDGGPGGARWYDKVPSKFEGWGAEEFGAAGFRVVPSAVVRYSAYVAPGAVLMPCFVNLGAYVGPAPWSTPGRPWVPAPRSAPTATISGGVGLGGVLEPLQANPVIVEDNVFIGRAARWSKG